MKDFYFYVAEPLFVLFRSELSTWDWFKKAMLLDFNRAAAAREGEGDIQGVEQWLLLKSHWSRRQRSSSALGPPVIGTAESVLKSKSNAVVRSHICMAPLLCPVKINLRGRDPSLLEPSHSCTQKAVTVVPSTAFITQTLHNKKMLYYLNYFHKYICFYKNKRLK